MDKEKFLVECHEAAKGDWTEADRDQLKSVLMTPVGKKFISSLQILKLATVSKAASANLISEDGIKMAIRAQGEVLGQSVMLDTILDLAFDDTWVGRETMENV